MSASLLLGLPNIPAEPSSFHFFPFII